jgi:hypothetical protein
MTTARAAAAHLALVLAMLVLIVHGTTGGGVRAEAAGAKPQTCYAQSP